MDNKTPWCPKHIDTDSNICRIYINRGNKICLQCKDEYDNNMRMIAKVINKVEEDKNNVRNKDS